MTPEHRDAPADGDSRGRVPLRSAAWFGGDDEVAMLHRVAIGMPRSRRGRPVIGIADTTSDFNPCHSGFEAVLPDLVAGIEEAGGVAARFPTLSLGEDLMKPSAMLYRNLAAMELEEQLRSYPLDGVVLLANCDKTVPAALLAAVSAGLPALLLLGGARRAVCFEGREVGSGTGVWRALDERRAGHMDDRRWSGFEQCLGSAGGGACNVMGTASTNALITEALGLCLPGSTGQPAGGPELAAIARRTGAAVVAEAHATQVGDASAGTAVGRIDQRMIDNALRVIAAVGGSTNAVIHLAAVAGRLGLDAGLRRADELWRDVPLIADVEPAGGRSILDFARAGGYLTLARSLATAGWFDDAVPTATGERVAELPAPNPTADGVIRHAEDPVSAAPTLAAIFGSLAPDGAVIKTVAASPELQQHTGRAIVFDDYETMRDRLDHDVSIDPDAVLVVRNAGPVGVPGMPEWGMAPLPASALAAGVTDMVRISDGRMSGTSFGTVVLHVAPEAAVGGPLALVAEGDEITLDVPRRRLDLAVDDDVLRQRRAAWQPPPSPHLRGWPRLYQATVQQAPQGCDLDFLAAPTVASRVFVPPVVGRS